MKAMMNRLLPVRGFVAALLGATLLGAPTALAYYDPGVQRWINRDPVAEVAGVNLYLVGENEPVGQIDAVGLAVTPATVVPSPKRPDSPPSVGELCDDLQRSWDSLPYSPTNVGSGDACATRGGTVNTGNGLPSHPQQDYPRCNEAAKGYSKCTGKSKASCPGGTSVNCVDSATCQKALDGKLRWLPHKKCAKCPDGTRIQY